MDKEIIKKIDNLNLIKGICNIGMIIVGVITIIDLFVPDPIFLLDEAALAAITGLFKVLSSIVEKKINLLSNGEKLDINTEDTEEVASALKDTVKAVKKSRNK